MDLKCIILHWVRQAAIEKNPRTHIYVFDNFVTETIEHCRHAIIDPTVSILHGLQLVRECL